MTEPEITYVAHATIAGFRNYTTETLKGARDTAGAMLESGRFKNPDTLRGIFAFANAEIARRLPVHGDGITVTLDWQ
jgi:hypothetical protein